jgi:hypothetical protein
MEITGQIKRQSLGVGLWSLVSRGGDMYELYKPPAEICQDNLSVKIKGQVREEIMTTAMIGPVLEIKSYQIIDPEKGGQQKPVDIDELTN